MKQAEVTQDQFAQWSFERDLKEGLFQGTTIRAFSDLESEEQGTYQQEAHFYLTQHRDDWPTDILKRLED